MSFANTLGLELISIDLKQFSSISEKQYEVISSQKIRKLIQNGQLKQANDLLGRNWCITGNVKKGKQQGREIGFPTANLSLKNFLKPPLGVYISRLKIISHQTQNCGMCNIGHKPTVSNENMTSIEVHIFNYNNFDLYNQIIEIEFVDYVRNEIKFENIEDLKLQLIKDKEYCEDLQF
jgi:riboflavin kinase/FMN adenylyltransferase